MSTAAEAILRGVVPKPDDAPSSSPAPTAHLVGGTSLNPAHTSGAPLHAGSGGVDDLRAALRHVRAKLTVCVGAADISVDELLTAQEHHVLRLDRAVEQPVDILLEGHVVARGTLIAVDEHFAVRITELPTGAGAPPHLPDQGQG
jgi:flagellar motor switch protein FliN